MIDTVKKSAMGVAALAALALGGAAIADAGDNRSGSASSANAANAANAADRPGPRGMRPPRPDPLSSENAAKVKAAALKEVPGATVLDTHGGGPYSTPYHAHIRTSGGARRVVLVNDSFEATRVQADRGPRGRGGRPGEPGFGPPPGPHGPHGRHGGPGHGERPLTGETKEKVEAAVKAKYPDATILRTETNRDGSAPYESHIRTSDGKHLEVLVNKDFEVVGANEHPRHP